MAAISSAIYEDLGELKHMVHVLGLKNRVIFTGFVPKTAYIHYMKHTDFFVSLSLHEGFGIPAFEALLCSKPIVLADIETYREIEKDAACYVSPRSPSEIAKAMYSVLENTSLRRRDVKRKAMHLGRLYRKTKMAQQILDCYNENIHA